MPSDDTDRKSDAEKLVSGLKSMMEDSTPDDAYWCGNCGEYSVTEILQPIQRPEFGKENDLWGCTECRYCFVPATEWREMDADIDRSEDTP